MKLIRVLLFPFVIFYGCFVVIRNTLFNLNIIKKNKTNIYSIGVGNLSLGGSGKSILVDYLISKNIKTNLISVISRGYGRKSSGFILANSKSNAAEIGDEPFQYLNKYPKIKVAVAEKRTLAVKKISKLNTDIDLLIFDDIMQHRSILTNHLIITTTFNKPFFKDCLFPAGNLREFRIGRKRGNTILVTKCPKYLSPEDRVRFSNSLKLFSNQKAYFTTISYSETIINSIKKINLQKLINKKITLVTGIADPSDLLIYLNSINITFNHLKFRDHFNFDQKAILKINKMAQNTIVLTTEKDYGRLSPFLKSDNLFYIPVKLSFFSKKEETEFNKRVKSFS